MSTAKTNNTKQPKSEREPLKLGETQRWVICFTMMCVALFVLIAILSYYFTWKVDQIDGAKVNYAGAYGYRIADFLVGDCFGALAVCIPLVIIVLSLRVMQYRPPFLERSVRIMLFVMILGAVTFAFFFPSWRVFGSSLGGKTGMVVSLWLVDKIGKMGLGLLLCFSWIILAVYINRRTIKAVNNVARKTASLLAPKPSYTVAEGESETAEAEPDDSASPDAPAGDTAGMEGFDPNADPDIDPVVEPTAGTTDDEWVDRVAPDEPSVETPDTAEAAAAESTEPKNEAVTDQNNIPDDGVVMFGSGASRAAARTGAPHRAEPVGGFEVIEGDGGMAGINGKEVLLSTGGVVESDAEGIKVLQTALVEEEADEDDIKDSIDPTRKLPNYQRPPIEILERHDDDEVQYSSEEINENKAMIQRTLGDFGIKINRIRATIGPTVTLYEIEPAKGVKVSRIKNLEDDIALSLKATSIRIIAPIPGRGTIGIEIPNSNRKMVSMYSVVKSVKFQDCTYELPVVLGKTIQNETFIIDLAKMPHLLVAGATGQGKSVGLNAIIASLIYKKHPAELKFVLVDPKKVELSLYAKLERFFLAKMPSEDHAILTDTQKVVNTLHSLLIEMQNRYDLFEKAEVKKITEYNNKLLQHKLPRQDNRYLPYIVVVIDEFADLIMTAGKEVEIPLTRLAQLARAVGIHLIVATQRPDVKVITGLIKANFPARIAFRVTQMVDSRTIIDQPGANQLIGQGDMLIMINGELTRLQCAFLDTPEIERITEFVAKQQSFKEAYRLPDYVPESAQQSGGGSDDMGRIDDMFDEVARYVVSSQIGSTSNVQRKFSIGYNRAGRLMDQLEKAGIVSPAEGSKPREVLIADPSSLERILNSFAISNLDDRREPF